MNNKTFKLSAEDLKKMSGFFLIVFVIAGFIGSYFFPWLYVLFFEVAMLISLLFAVYPILGLYLMAFFMPFWGLRAETFGFSVPYVDLFALLLLAGILMRMLTGQFLKGAVCRPSPEEPSITRMPGWTYALIFFVASALSFINTPHWQLSAEFFLRPLVFAYIMFMVLPFNIIKSKVELKKILWMILAGGLLSATLGFLTVLFSEGGWFMRRATPWPIFGLNWLEGNHNAVAESLIIAVPAALFLFFTARKIKHQGWYLLAILFMSIVLMLTFSRTGWLVLGLQVLALALFLYKDHLIKFKFKKFEIIAVLVLLVLAMGVFYSTVWVQEKEVQTSTSNRLMMTMITLSAWGEHPFVGHGLGTFQEIIGETFAFWVQYGDPLDAHGFIQKLLTETGLFGFISFVIFFIWLFYRTGKMFFSVNHEGQMLILALFLMAGGMFFAQLFSTSYFIAKMWLPCGLMLVGSELVKKDPRYAKS